MFMSSQFRVILLSIDTLCNLKGQDEKVANVVEDVSLSVEVSSVRDCFPSTNTNPTVNSVHPDHMRIESSANSLLQETESSNLNSQNENMDNTVENISLSTDVSFMKNHSKGSCTITDLHSDGYILPPTESLSNSSFVGKVSPNLNGQHEKAGDVTETISLLADVSIMENHSSSSNINPSLNLDEHVYLSLESSDTATLEEKVANFIQNGDLDVIECMFFICCSLHLSISQLLIFTVYIIYSKLSWLFGAAWCSDNAYGILNETDNEEGEEVIDLEDAIEDKSRTSDAVHLEQIFDDRVDRAMILNGSALTSKQIASVETGNCPLRLVLVHLLPSVWFVANILSTFEFVYYLNSNFLNVFDIVE